MNNYRTIQQKVMHTFFPAWEQNIPSLGTNDSQVGNKTPLRLAVTLLLMLVLGVNIAWAQETDYSGVYYIGSNGYKAGNTSTNYYLCPTEEWCYYKATNEIWPSNTAEANQTMPFLTTYRCRNNENEYDATKAVWNIKKHASENYYYIIQAKTGRYLMANGQIQTSTNADRMRVHLEEVSDPNGLDDKALFDIHLYNNDHLVISSKSSVGWNVNNKWLTVNNGNYNNLVGNAGKTGGPTGYENVAGIICIYTESDARADFYLEKAAVNKPEITNNFRATNTFAITAETGANIYYTTDGSDPTISNYTGTGTTSVNVNLTGDMTVIKAIAKGASDYFPSLVETYEIPVCERPVITVSGGTVTITCATEGATIYYTTDGNPANTTSSNSSSSPVSFPQGEISTIRAIATSPGYVKSAEAQLLPPTIVHSSSEILNDLGGNYILADDFTLSGSIGTSDNPFTGTINGNMITRTFSYPLVAYADGATIKNVILKDVTISGDIGGDDEMENVGAICNEARGASRIYNCGVLGTLTETKDEYGNVTKIESTSSITGSGNVGSIVGLLDGTSRVINCYSYATVSGGTMAAGIVGNNAQASTQSSLKTIVVNCMFYGDISGDGSKYPVYGNNSINNASDTGINPYCYFRKNATFTPTDYNRSWPAEEKNLTRFEYYRSVLNSNRKLCTWWVNGTNGTAPTDNDVFDVGIAKWVLDPSIAPYPILKKWGKYPSVINQDPDKRVDSSTKTWVNRDNASANWGKDMAPDTEGQILGTVSVTINAGSHHSGTKHPTGSTSKSINITAMDTEYNDYCYGKIQLPYYNEIFGNPNEADHAAKYAGNYTDWVVTGWEISGGSDAEDFNFADRNSYKGRIFAQGGYFYVPDGVTSISITAHWGKAVYLSNRGYSIDRVKVTAGDYRKADKTEAKNFAPAGTVSSTFQGNTVYDDLQTAISALGSSTDYPTVYDQAIVLIGNHQVKNGSESVAGSANNWHPFTIMSADFDFDNEPDFCLQLQFRAEVDRPGIQPIRFDFLPVIELGLAVRHNNFAYAIGIFVPQGHFEITETAFMRTTQFEWDTNKSGSTGKTRMDNNSPVILNGGEFEQLAVRYGNGNRTSYFLLGGNLWFHRFAPGSHPNKGNDNNPTIRLCPVNVIGGDFPEFYLSGLYRPDKDPYSDQGDPKCYINGGHFGTIHGSGYDKIAGSVTFKIDHAVISEFYGGGINGSNPIGGNIDVTIDNSRVDKYCGGPEVGDMTGKTVTTHATGTTFGVFYGGGNGGNSYYRHLEQDGDQDSGHIGTWTDKGYNWNGFNPLGVKDDDIANENKGYHAEYEFEVFNQSNGVADQITQRGFIKWIQFGITKTGNVSNTLSNCKILNNFYGGGNLATVAGTVTSELTNTIVEGSVFGGGYSAAIPTFQVHDKGTAVFPSITAGVITDGHIDYDSKVYEWTNEPDTEEHNADYMKAHPTYQKNGKWYCYTWNSLDDLGAVTGNVSLTIDGNTTLTDGKVMKVNESVYGGGESSDVAGNTEVKIKAGKVEGNVYGGGKIGDVGTHEQIPEDNDGNYNWKDQDGNLNTPANSNNKNTGVCKVEITGGTIGPDGNADDDHGNVFGGGKGDDTTFWCEKAMVYSTNVTINNGMVKGDVFGGGEIGRVETDAVVKIGDGEGVASGDPTSAPEIKGSVFGAGKGLITHGYSALVRGNVTLTIEGNAKVHKSVYGGGELASVGKHKVKTSNDPLTPTDAPADLPVGMPYTLDGTNVGECTVNVQGYAEITNNVFGAGQGVGAADYNYDSSFQRMGMNGWEGLSEEDYSTFLQTLALTTDTDVNIGGNAKVKKSVYGGSENGFVQYDTDVSIQGSCEIGTSGTTSEGNVYGGGRGISGNTIAGPVSGNSIVTINGGTTYGSVYGGGAYGVVKESVAVNVTGGEVKKDVYGGGALAHTNTANWTGAALVATYPYHEVTGLTVGTSVVTGLYTKDGNTYTAATGMAAANTTYYRLTNTKVSLTGGNILGAAYGGGLGAANTPAYVYSDVLVDLNGTTTMSNGKATTNGTALANTAKGCIVNQVFGCNNVNGSPKGDVMVHVFATQNVAKDAVNGTVAQGSEEADKVYLQRLIDIAKPGETVVDGVDAAVIADAQTKHDSGTDEEVTAAITAVTAELGKMYDVSAVYGGGNNAAYIPTTAYTESTPTGSKAQVVIEGCDNTSIKYVYGGGNAAPVPDTYVLVKGTKIIDYVFGGGNGTVSAADVGYDGNGNTQGDGNANTTLMAGYIHNVYGASNTNGDIRGKANITKVDKPTGASGCCDKLVVNKMYSAGKDADISGGSKVILGCMEDDWIEEYYGGAENANVLGDVELTITSGKFRKVFGGNKTSGAIFGHIKVNIEETSCIPIYIDELYGCGNEAPYSIYGYSWDGTSTNPNNGKKIFTARTSASDGTPVKPDGSAYTNEGDDKFTAYDSPEVNIISATRIGKVFGGGLGSNAIVYGDPTVNINMIYGTPGGVEADALGEIGDVFGGGNAANVIGNTTVNIGTKNEVWLHQSIDDNGNYTMYPANTDSGNGIPVKGANITGNVYGGGKLANVGYLDDDTKENDPNSVYCNTFVNIGAKEVTENNTKVWKSVVQGTAGVTILGNVYGGGEGEANASTYKCDKAMVVGNTNVRIGNGTVGTLDNNNKLVDGTGNVYGGGEIGRVEKNSTVTIGFETGTSTPNIKGNVYGAGSGVTTHGYSALVRGNSEVTVQGNAKVDGSVYGGGETASVGRYNIATTQALATQYNVEVGEPYSLISGGKSKVTIQGNAEIGPDDMKMTATGGPDDAGHVFGAGKGVLPYQNLGTEGAGRYYLVNDVITWEPYGESNEDDYEKYMLTLALSDNTDVTIAGSAFVKGSVYGGSENGHVRTNTLVKIEGGQIGAGYDKDKGESLSKYSDGQFIDPATTPVTAANSLATCAAWPYDKETTGKPYDMYEGTQGYDSKGGADAAHANDGHTFYGNVFAGGSGYYPYAPGKWLESAGSVGGNTEVRITAGHILSNVYGGNEQTNVEGSCTITMSGGTVGVPRTKDQIEKHPVVGNLFGAGKGDKRVLFNTWTNVASTSITINGGIVYGSVFGGGEDGHVMGNATTLIQEASGKTITIGSTGESGADGNVFGGGRGSETALTAGVVGGNVSLTINSGTIKGSVYGGGRLASVGTNFVNPDNVELYGKLQTPDADHGNITININDGTIGNTNSTGVSGNIYGGSKGTTSQFDLGIVRSTTINMTGGTAYASVYGGGELAQVVGSHTTSGQALGTEINISGGTIGTAKANLPEGTTYGATYGNVYGGGKGNTTHVEAGLIKTNTKVSISQASGKTTLVRHNIYGGGAYGSVGEFNYDGTTGMPTGRKDNTTGGKAIIAISGGTIGEDGHENGMIFGSSRGDIGAPGEIHDKLAWVYDTEVTVNDGQIKGSIYGGGENGHVYHDAAVNVHGGTIGISEDPDYAYRGNVYGGGCGTDKYDSDDDDTEDSYNPLAGIVYGNATVLIDGGHVVHNVYGAGAMGSVGKASDAASGKTTINISGGRIGYDGEGNGHVFGAARGDLGVSTAASNLANVRETEVNINYATTPAADNEGKTVQLIAGSVFGGGEAGTVKGSVAVNMTGGLILKDIYGGGALADTQTSNWDATSNTWATGMVTNGKTTYTTTVNLFDGTIGGDAYGGGLGQKTGFNGGTSDIEAMVYGDVTVNLGDEGATKATAFNISYEDTDDKDDNNNYIQVVGSGRVFGCNNLNGSPQGNVTVNIYKTVEGNVPRTAADPNTGQANRTTSVDHNYEVAAVYGGGNLADYTATGKKASVVIHSCDVSVQYVYGGGNAASVPETDVLVKGAWEIDHVFGGGNGKDKYKKGNAWIANAGANVNGNTNTLLIGGYIHEAYGGSNEKGTITGNVTINTDADNTACACALDLVKLYGAGKNADIEGDLIVVLECAPETKTEEIYGGAENANVKGNVELTITSGTFGKVFGGNNQSGAIFGHIILNIEETGCRPINIDELYGCGNNAAYSVYGYKNGGTDYEGYPIYVPRTSKDDGTPVTFAELPHTVLNNTKPQYNDPELNIISCTSIGKVFGGGLGAGATVYGNPTVNINQIKGDWAGKTIGTGESAITIPNQLGEIGCGYINENSVRVEGGVFGGGNEANVVGNTNVNIGTEAEVYVVKFVDVGASVKDYYTRNNDGTYTATAATETAKADTYYYKKETVLGANIIGNVYGGGNEAEVTGDTNVNIGKKSE